MKISESTDNILKLFRYPSVSLTVNEKVNCYNVNKIIDLVSGQLGIEKTEFFIEEQEFVTQIFLKHPTKSKDEEIIKIYWSNVGDTTEISFGHGRFIHHIDCGYMFFEFKEIEDEYPKSR